jgi:23S rRNA pseudouridine1911/1915/1917 synthase
MQILFEDNHLVIVHKEAGEIVQPDPTGDPSLEDKIKDYIKEKYQKPGEVFLGVVHRIDRPVSGTVIFARTSKALVRLNQMMQDHQIKKTYWAIVKNPMPHTEGTLTHYIFRDSSKNKSFCTQPGHKNAKEAILHYRTLSASDHYYLLEIHLETGRHHQIRCQLAKAGSPIRGDLKYGFDRSNPDGSISLHARSVEFTHPVTKEKICIEAPEPQDALWKALTCAIK